MGSGFGDGDFSEIGNPVQEGGDLGEAGRLPCVAALAGREAGHSDHGRSVVAVLLDQSASSVALGKKKKSVVQCTRESQHRTPHVRDHRRCTLYLAGAGLVGALAAQGVLVHDFEAVGAHAGLLVGPLQVYEP